MRRVVVGLCSVLWLVTALYAEHRVGLEWMRGYRSVTGEGCCDISDCVPADVTLLSEPIGPTVRVLVTRVETWDHRLYWPNTVVEVPTRSVHRSEDATGYWCHRSAARVWNGRKACFTEEGEPEITSECARCLFLQVGS